MLDSNKKLLSNEKFLPKPTINDKIFSVDS